MFYLVVAVLLLCYLNHASAGVNTDDFGDTPFLKCQTNQSSATAQIQGRHLGQIRTEQLKRHLATLVRVRMSHHDHELLVLVCDTVVTFLDIFLMEALLTTP